MDTSLITKNTKNTYSGKLNLKRSKKELAKTGMIASMTTVTLTGFRVIKPLAPLHPIAGVLFLGFTLWHIWENEKIVKGNSKKIIKEKNI